MKWLGLFAFAELYPTTVKNTNSGYGQVALSKKADLKSVFLSYLLMFVYLVAILVGYNSVFIEL